MYHEEVAQWAADHLRTHIRAYLDEVNARFTDNTTLTTPKAIEVASEVGGLFTTFDEILPQYGIDILGKVFSDGDDLYTYLYSGQINGMVSGQSSQSVDRMITRHSSAVELFIRRHQVAHEFSTNDFRILEVGFDGVQFSGAEDLGEVAGRQLWIAGFSIDFSLLTSEDGPAQHG